MAADAPAGEPLRVLLVEDSAVDARLVAAFLEEGGFAAQVQRVDTEEAFRAALAAGCVDVILSDYRVPGFEGTEALAAARQACPEAPFVFVSGALGEDKAIELLKRGATDYVLKDNLARLAPSIRRARAEAHERAERQRAEEELRRRAEFEQQLIGIVSHDLRNPVGAIMVSASLLQRQGLDDRQARAVARIMASAERATRMIRDLLDFTQARLGGGIPLQRAPADLHQLGGAVVEEVRASHPDQRVLHEAQGEARGDWDADRVAQVLSNLLGNAVRHAAEGTAVTLRTWGEPGRGVLEVHNVGEPIPRELLGDIFQPLRRATTSGDRHSRSIGLGLFIVDHVVKAHGGRVEVTSSAEEGTRFRVHLPVNGPSPSGRGSG